MSQNSVDLVALDKLCTSNVANATQLSIRLAMIEERLGRLQGHLEHAVSDASGPETQLEWKKSESGWQFFFSERTGYDQWSMVALRKAAATDKARAAKLLPIWLKSYLVLHQSRAKAIDEGLKALDVSEQILGSVLKESA
ncbi:MAG TPA: hypothetical protein VG797_11820 [Phycisphaerales bacterium]|nr:hypothetical protein [Phycisphaerales bacterium]